MRAHEATDSEISDARPQRRIDCAEAARPCPWIACRWHLAEPSVNLRSIRVLGEVLPHDADAAETDAFAERAAEAVAAMTESCALDVADRDAATLDGVGSALGVTRERVRQIEGRAMTALVKPAKRLR